MDGAQFDVVGVGNAIVDVLSKIDNDTLERLGLKKGAMTLIDNKQAQGIYENMPNTIEVSGGSAANTLVGIASLGGQGAYIGKVCDDQLGKVFIRDLYDAGIQYPLRPARSGPSTARCLIFVTPDAERTMQTFLGASVLLGPEDIDPETIGGAKITYLEGYLFDNEEAKKAFVKAAKLAHLSGRKVALTLSDSFCVERHRAAFKELIKGHIDIVFANSDEMLSLFETTSFEKAIASIRGSVELAAITRGKDGSVIVTGEEIVEIRAEKIDKIVDTTGAGDLYAAGVLYGVSAGYENQLVGRIGSICASEVISHFGARPELSLASLVKQKL